MHSQYDRPFPQPQFPDPDRDAQFYDGVPLKRLMAWVIDSVLIMVASVLVTGVLAVLTLGLMALAFPFVIFGISFAYRWLTIASRSATLGMALMGIELRGHDGQRLPSAAAAMHSAAFVLLTASLVGWVVTIASILSTRHNRGLPDFLVGTVVINRPMI